MHIYYVAIQHLDILAVSPVSVSCDVIIDCIFTFDMYIIDVKKKRKYSIRIVVMMII